MRLRGRLMMSAVVLLVGGCATGPAEVRVVGDFCDVAKGIPYGSVESADWNAENDPLHADAVTVHNTYGERECGWEF